ncbi:YwmB family TATA-box binding protein [Candidatus Formimonas warabiya]|uniref:TATA-box binding n=1 Tax=Formimonas warabiya TaxID=1761012 RepID=A0A3G1KUV6_FORW1|nr:YwmB family TATA-box binding protein [Candidatus Formimonas warabiya]ATW25975.1 hypothetical protein DCMF_15380 [Candidatus Formimonas warabiya]
MKKYLLPFLLLLELLAGILIVVNFYLRDINPVMKTVDQPMQAAFESSKSVFSEVKLQGWAKVDEKFCSAPELDHYGGLVENILGAPASLTRERIADEGFHSLQLKGKLSQGQSVEIIFQSLQDKKKDDKTYLIINMVDTRGPESLDWSKEKMVAAFREFQKEPELNQLMVGFKPGKLTKSAYRTLINEIFSSIGGKISGGVEEENYISKTGYVPNIHDKLKVGSNDVNMQVAMSYNELENKTYIYIGSPLVFYDY